MEITVRLQVKFNQVMQKYQPYFSLPEYKFLRQICYGILTSKHVHINKIGAVLQEYISLKKTTERLSRNLGRKGFWAKLTRAHLEVNKRALRRCEYLILDISDITKSYAQQMEGLEYVRDGSRKSVGLGYWLTNVIAVDESGEEIVPAYSELYALQQEKSPEVSENQKILEAISTVQDVLGKEQVIVDDRGGDRRVLIERFLEEGRYFIIRQTGQRDLHTGKKRTSLRSISRKIRLHYHFTVTKERHGKRKVETYVCGAKRVYFPNAHTDSYWETPLWLVKAQRKGKGALWYLCSLPVEDEQSAIEMAMRGYGLRWRIEEYHRQIKSDYHLEEICLRRYAALKNFLSLFLVTMGFVYHHFGSLSLAILRDSSLKLVYRGTRLKEYFGFIYYKIAKALCWYFSKFKLKNRVYFPAKKVDNQLTFDFL